MFSALYVFFFLIKKVFCTLYNSSFGVLFDFFLIFFYDFHDLLYL